MKIISIWDSRFASEYNFEFKLVELNHSLVTFAQNYEKYAFVLTEQERNYRLGLKKLKAEFAEKYKKQM